MKGIDLFSYTSLAKDELFIGREDLLKHLNSNIELMQNTTLYGQRRVGKSSLVFEVIRRFKKSKDKHLFINLDLTVCNNSGKFIALLSQAIENLISSHKPLSSQFQKIYNFISGIRPVVTIDPINGEPQYSIGFDGDNRTKSLEEIFRLLESISNKFKLTIVLDEFQSILDWDDSNSVQWQIRSHMQRNKAIHYIFTGSSQSLINKLFYENKGAFYRSTDIIFVNNSIDPIIFSKWIKQRFQKADYQIDNETIKTILDITNMHPYYTQKLLYHLWREAREVNNRKINLESLQTTLKAIITMETNIYQERLSHLAKNSRQVLLAISQIDPEEKIYSKTIIKKYQLKNPSTVQKAIEELKSEATPLIFEENNQYRFEDPFFKLWLQTIP